MTTLIDNLSPAEQKKYVDKLEAEFYKEDPDDNIEAEEKFLEEVKK